MKVIDVVIPVYNAPEDLAACVDSVLAHTEGNYRLVLIDDASPDPAIQSLFVAFAARNIAHLTLLANPVNLGFTGTANRGMALSRNDVVLLNSDTLVTHGWLDALRACAASDTAIGTITPFSNNAEILSYPVFCADNGWMPGRDPEPTRAALAAAAVPTYPDIPTGVGFCFYVRRTLLDEVGAFDPVFGAGYGEENDFCLRAAAFGWRNVLCDDAFVVHTGARSFVAQKQVLVPRNTATLLKRHPGYGEIVQRYIAADPLRPLRAAALSQDARISGAGIGVLHIVHHHGGGTESHVRELIDASRGQARHYLVVAVGDDWHLEEHRADGSVCNYPLRREYGEAWPQFLRALCTSFGIGVVHVHNLSACREGVIAALQGAGVPYGYTVHDVSFACPTITFIDAAGRYCGLVTDNASCARCLGAQPEFANVDIATWRSTHAALVAGAAFLIAPSQWAADAFARYFGRLPEVVPHGHLNVAAQTLARAAGASALAGTAQAVTANGARMVALLPDDDYATIVVLGAVGPDKGARRLEQLAALAAATQARLRFVLIGYLDVQRGPWQDALATLTVHGGYTPEQLPALLRHYRARMVLYTSIGPETFSYTLSETWFAGLPAVVPPIGALAERVKATGAGIVLTQTQWHDETALLAELVALVAAEDAVVPGAALALARQRVAHVVAPTLSAMAAAALGAYAAAYVATGHVAALSGEAGPAQGLHPQRLRDALGYRPWLPPAPPPSIIAARRSLRWKLAMLVKRLRRTSLGADLHARLPASWTDALRARLR